MLGLLFLLADLLHGAAEVNSLKPGCMLSDLPFYILQVKLQKIENIFIMQVGTNTVKHWTLFPDATLNKFAPQCIFNKLWIILSVQGDEKDFKVYVVLYLTGLYFLCLD